MTGLDLAIGHTKRKLRDLEIERERLEHQLHSLERQRAARYLREQDHTHEGSFHGEAHR